MASVADLLDQGAVDRLAALRIDLGQHDDQAARRQSVRAVASAPQPPATCPECGQLRPVPPAVFREAGL